MTADQPTSSRTELGLHTRNVSRAAVVGWLVAFTAIEWLRYKAETSGPLTGLEAFAQAVPVLELLEIVFLARMIDWKAAQPRIGLGEAAATLVGIAFVTLVGNGRAIFSAGLLASYALCRFAGDRQHRALVIGLFAFVAQYLLDTGPFLWLHELVSRLDASVLRAVLNFAGYDVGGAGTFVAHPSENFAINIVTGCSSSHVVAIVAPGFIITVLGLRGSLRRSDLGYLAGLLAATVCLNWLRLLPTAISRAGYQFWHDGTGASMLAATYAVLVLGMGYWATRETKLGQAAQ